MKRLSRLLTAPVRLPSPRAALALAISFGAILALFLVLEGMSDPPEILPDLLSLLFVLWVVSVVVYLALILDSYYKQLAISRYSAFVTALALHAAALAVLVWGAFVLDFTKSYTAEFIGFDFWICVALFIFSACCVCGLILLRSRKAEWASGTRTLMASTTGASAILLLFATGIYIVVPAFQLVYADYGIDLPGPTQLVFDVHRYAYVLPLLCIVFAGARLERFRSPLAAKDIRRPGGPSRRV